MHLTYDCTSESDEVVGDFGTQVDLENKLEEDHRRKEMVLAGNDDDSSLSGMYSIHTG